jgi:hypothetical protein
MGIFRPSIIFIRDLVGSFHIGWLFALQLQGDPKLSVMAWEMWCWKLCAVGNTPFF